MIAPTCTEEGYSLYACRCGDTLKTEYKDALGHAPELKNNKEASCEVDGYSGDEICRTCGETITEGEIIAAEGHKWNKGVIIKEATESEEGLKRYICTVCGNSYDEIIPTVNHKHRYTATEIAPTCTEDGYTLYACSCGDTLKGEYKDAPGHSFSGGKCNVCGAADPDYVVPTPPVEPIVPTNPFKDVAEGAFYYEPVLWAVENKITDGTGPDTFSPSATCTRGQVVTFLWRAAGSPKVVADNPFEDVDAGAFYYDAVLWAVKNGITEGKTRTTFGPNDPCTRGHVVTFLYRAAKGEKVDKANPFRDVDAGAFYYDAVLWAVENKITEGKNRYSFGPSDPCTRGHIVTFLYRSAN